MRVPAWSYSTSCSVKALGGNGAILERDCSTCGHECSCAFQSGDLARKLGKDPNSDFFLSSKSLYWGISSLTECQDLPVHRHSDCESHIKNISCRRLQVAHGWHFEESIAAFT
jgi:hypothetical protein